MGEISSLQFLLLFNNVKTIPQSPANAKPPDKNPRTKNPPATLTGFVCILQSAKHEVNAKRNTNCEQHSNNKFCRHIKYFLKKRQVFQDDIKNDIHQGNL